MPKYSSGGALVVTQEDGAGVSLPAIVAAADAMANPTARQMLAHLMLWNGVSWQRQRDGNTNGDASGAGGFAAIAPWIFNGTLWDRQKTPIKLVDLASTSITAGTPLTVYTPTSGKKFRLFGWSLSAAVAGSIIFKFAAGGTLWFRTPALAAAGVGGDTGSLGNGMQPPALAANDVLKLDVTATGAVAGYLVLGEE